MITDRKSYKVYCQADRLANSIPVREKTIKKIMQLVFPNPIRKFLFLLRKTEYIKNCKSGISGKIFYLFYFQKFIKISRKLGFSIPLNVFGPGLSIPHYGTIVVNPATKVGKNCRLHVCVNIGASGGSELAPKIGDNVYIGPGAIIFGDIIIANNITIAANATVYKSIEITDVTIGGTPAIILKEETSVWWVKNRVNLER
jgi:serine O-acetyltransferase